MITGSRLAEVSPSGPFRCGSGSDRWERYVPFLSCHHLGGPNLATSTSGFISLYVPLLEILGAGISRPVISTPGPSAASPPRRLSQHVPAHPRLSDKHHVERADLAAVLCGHPGHLGPDCAVPLLLRPGNSKVNEIARGLLQVERGRSGEDTTDVPAGR